MPDPKVASSRRVSRRVSLECPFLRCLFPWWSPSVSKFERYFTLSRGSARILTQYWLQCWAVSTIIRFFSVSLTRCFVMTSNRLYKTVCTFFYAVSKRTPTFFSVSSTKIETHGETCHGSSFSTFLSLEQPLLTSAALYRLGSTTSRRVSPVTLSSP